MNDNATVAKYDSGGGYAGERKLSSALPITPESIGLTLMVAGKKYTWEDILELYAYIHYTDNVDWDRLMAYFEGMKRRENSG
jgi:hypothetical protein